MKNISEQNDSFNKKLADYQELCDYVYDLHGLNAEKIAALLRKGVSVCDPDEDCERNDIIKTIITHSPDEQTAIELLQLIHNQDNTLIQKQATKGAFALFYTSAGFRRWQVTDFLLTTAKVPIETVGRQKHTALYHLVQPEHMFPEIVIGLVKRGANPFLVDIKENKRPIDFITDETLKKTITELYAQFQTQAELNKFAEKASNKKYSPVKLSSASENNGFSVKNCLYLIVGFFSSYKRNSGYMPLQNQSPSTSTIKPGSVKHS